jgi:hypothetical protein
VSVLQFQISRVAADAVKLDTIAAKAANAAGVPHAALAYSAVTIDDRHVRIRCHRRMALFLLEQLRAVSRSAEARGDSTLLAESTAATEAILAAIGPTGPASGGDS